MAGGGKITDHLPGWYRETDDQMLGFLQGIMDRQEEQEQDDPNRNS